MDIWNDYASDFFRSIQHDINERIKYEQGKEITGAI